MRLGQCGQAVPLLHCQGLLQVLDLCRVERQHRVVLFLLRRRLCRRWRLRRLCRRWRLRRLCRRRRLRAPWPRATWNADAPHSGQHACCALLELGLAQPTCPSPCERHLLPDGGMAGRAWRSPALEDLHGLSVGHPSLRQPAAALLATDPPPGRPLIGPPSVMSTRCIRSLAPSLRGHRRCMAPAARLPSELRLLLVGVRWCCPR